jgi:hypothetical protein
MLRKAKVAAVSAAALLLVAMPAFGSYEGGDYDFGRGNLNVAVVKGNDVSADANSGRNDQTQFGGRHHDSYDLFSTENGDGGYRRGGSQTQWMSTGDAVAEASQVIVANSNACGCDQHSRHGRGTTNVALVWDNDVSADANSGRNDQTQFGGSRQRQGMSTGFAGAAASQWIVVNSQGSL